MFRHLLSPLLAAVGLLTLASTAPAAPTLPNINPNNIVNITSFGAVSSTTLTNTAAIQKAIDSAATTNGGCTVEIPAGTYLSGPLTMRSGINLQLDSGAILRMLPYGSYPGSGNLVGATNVNDVEISGTGAIDGQGSAWWTAYNADSSVARPIMIRFQGCNRQLIQQVTLSNSPMFHISLSGSKGNATVQAVTISAPSTSPNTDACDVSGTNILVQNCTIGVGDDDFTCGGGTSDVLITNNTYGTGHGVSIGSYTSGGVSNFTVIDCSFTGTDNGFKVKSMRGRGGSVQNLKYINITMTNVDWPISFDAHYEWGLGQHTTLTPAFVANNAFTNPAALIVDSTPVIKNITASNVTAVLSSTRPPFQIWGLPEALVSNVVFRAVSITSSAPYPPAVYNATNIQFIDCTFNLAAGANNMQLWNAGLIFSNSPGSPTAANLWQFDGLTTNLLIYDGSTSNLVGNTLQFYNALGTLKNTNALDDGPLTLAASKFTVSNSLSLFPNSVVNFVLSTNSTTLAVTGTLALGGTNRISAGPGFTNGTYTLMTYSGALSGVLPALASVPGGYNYAFDTNTPKQVKLVVTLLPPANLTATASNLLVKLNWNSVVGATSYNLKRGTTNGGSYPTVFSGLTATNYSDANVTNAVNYYYVVTAVGAGGESTNSLPASAAPLPSNQPTNIVLQVGSGQMQLSWPPDHLGWRLQIQTNDLSTGLGTNWVTVPNSTNVISTNIVINPTNGSVFLRLAYP